MATSRISRNKHKERFDKSFKIRDISPLTKNQNRVFEQFKNNHIVMHGCAGTGKSFLALYLSLKEIEQNRYDKILLIRSAVPTRELGHLPGDMTEKTEVYEIPYKLTVNDLFYSNNNAYNMLKELKLVEFISTSYNRGLTWSNTLVIVDECQNMSFQELDTIITRIGEGSKLIFLGDTEQSDLIHSRNDQSGFPKFLSIISELESFSVIKFTVEDIVRSGLVKEYLKAKYRLLKG